MDIIGDRGSIMQGESMTTQREAKRRKIDPGDWKIYGHVREAPQS